MVTSVPRFLDEKKSLACVHCGLCLSACPTYLETGNENDSPRGRIYLMRALQDGRLPLADPTVRHIDLCLGCRACEAACPSGVQYGDLLETTRDHIEHHYRRNFVQRFLRRVVIEKIFPHPWRLRLALWPAKLIRALRLQALLPAFARESLALLPSRWPAVDVPSEPVSAPTKGRLGLIRGCVMDVLFGETNAATVRLLHRAGYEVIQPATQGCCGALFAHGGNLEQARACARQNIAAFENLGLDAIIINAAGCGSTLKEYGHLLAADPTWAERARQFSGQVKDLTEWLVQTTRPSLATHATGSRVTYHDACHLAHPQGITKPPRELIRSVAGNDFVELPESDVCCGSAGSYNLTEPAMAARLQRRKIENILRTGAKTVITTNPGCILQIQAGLRAAGANDVKVLHLADYIWSAAVPPVGRDK
jgi:glycolate oxidase iron-sulfur subunit